MAAMEREPFVTVCYADIANQVRGKGFPARDLPNRWAHGIGWTPTNIMINCFGRIPATPFGALGDLELVPDPAGEVRLEFDDGTREHFILGDVRNLDGSPWACCPRSLLKDAIARLEKAGLTLLVAFEHEFHYSAARERLADAYAIAKLRGVEPFLETLIAAMRANGLEPDTVLPEYGPKQFEITVDPAGALEAADRAVKLKEITRSVAERFGARASFSPLVTPGIVGNGVHIHFSLRDRDGTPVTYDPDGPAGLSPQAASFAAGILLHAPAFCSIAAPATISYERLKPNSWSAFWTNLGVRDREATVRVCPVPKGERIVVARRFNLEFRAADAAGNPYLQLAMLIRAGLAGLETNLPAPAILDGSPGDLSADERRRLGLLELPRSLAGALDLTEASPDVRGWMGEEFLDAFVMHKRGEAGMLDGLTLEESCRRYAEVY